ncbi:MAG: GyrI-like domain-containing protein [Acidobacteriota bacterium]
MPKTAVAEKVDLYKLHKADYAASKEPAFVEIKTAKYLTVEGRGEPGGEAFQSSVGALYQAAYTIKMTKKFAGRDYKVCTLEAQWWSDDPEKCFAALPKAEWRWKLMIRIPDFITAADLKAAVAKCIEKGKGGPVEKVRIESIKEGRCVQALHVGPYDQEGETAERMAAFATAKGLAPRGPHHEIYLSDPGRVAPERLKTILRQPVG